MVGIISKRQVKEENFCFSTSALKISLIVVIAILLNPIMVLPSSTSVDAELKIGWASVDITPDRPVLLAGMTRLRVSEGVMDSISATAMALESEYTGESVILISCDLLNISEEIRDRVREKTAEALPDEENLKVVLSATHTHVAPDYRISQGLIDIEELGVNLSEEWQTWGIELDVMSPLEYMKFASNRIAEAAIEAWLVRKEGGVSFGMNHAVAGHNRIMAYEDGSSQMYGATDRPDFSHVEGWEDHSVNLLYTWNRNGDLTGVLINLASPSQYEGGYMISADFWHDTREELRERLGNDIHVLPQCAAAGDQSQRVMIHRRAEQRMEAITGQNQRKRIAKRISDAVEEILPHMENNIDWNPIFRQGMEKVELTKRVVGEEDYESAMRAYSEHKMNYKRIRQEIDEHPEVRKEEKWYLDVAQVYRSMRSRAAIINRYHLQKKVPSIPVEVYVMRLGDMALATTRHELYLDYGIRIQERSKAVQTFIVQLAGSGGYLPSQRAVNGNAYGAQISQNRAGGPQGGTDLVEHTLELIESLFD